MDQFFLRIGGRVCRNEEQHRFPFFQGRPHGGIPGSNPSGLLGQAQDSGRGLFIQE